MIPSSWSGQFLFVCIHFNFFQALSSAAFKVTHIERSKKVHRPQLIFCSAWLVKALSLLRQQLKHTANHDRGHNISKSAVTRFLLLLHILFSPERHAKTCLMYFYDKEEIWVGKLTRKMLVGSIQVQQSQPAGKIHDHNISN